MGQSAEDLRHEIAGTRADLGETLDAIGDRVSPGRLIERRKNRMSNGLRSAKDRVFGTASGASDAVAGTAGSAVDAVRSAPDAARQQTQGNPMLAGAVAFGVGFLVAAAVPPSSTEEEAAGKVLEKAEPLKEQVTQAGQEVAGNLKDAASQAATQVKETATAGGQEVAATAKDAAQSTRSEVSGS
jgi:ElaB/YqjD/DUF883 family membrane-anchored ribosome-binding protein